jgi:4-hydroxy-tetrahydrodipicolinate synthase
VDEDFDLYTGDDETAVDFILAGGHGGISVSANIVPQQLHDIYAAALAGDAVKARELDAPLQQLHSDIFIESNPIPVKWVVSQMGFMGEAIRLPLTPLSEQAKPTVRQAVEAAGVKI